MIKKINQTKKYYNQYFDIDDIPKTAQNEKEITCNITSVSMITGENPNMVLCKFLKRYGQNKKFQWEENLISYLKENGFACYPVTELAWPKSKVITENDLEKMRSAIDKGKIIYYHEAGHYSLMIGYEKDENGEILYIFNDPAGDRKIRYSGKRTLESGLNVRYKKSFLEFRPLFGRCWAVTV